MREETTEIEWKIWILSTILENLDLHPEDESLLQLPGRDLQGLEYIETDVFIIGGGNSYVEDYNFFKYCYNHLSDLLSSLQRRCSHCTSQSVGC